MRTWKIINGDVALDTIGRVEEVAGSQKIVQDLKAWLLNDVGYDRFYPQMGAGLDSFVGQIIDYKLLASIRSAVADSLNNYMDLQMEDLRKRIEERGEPYIAIGLAEPSSLVKEWSKIEVTEKAGDIRIRIGFRTFTEDYEEVLLSISSGLNEKI